MSTSLTKTNKLEDDEEEYWTNKKGAGFQLSPGPTNNAKNNTSNSSIGRGLFDDFQTPDGSIQPTMDSAAFFTTNNGGLPPTSTTGSLVESNSDSGSFSIEDCIDSGSGSHHVDFQVKTRHHQPPPSTSTPSKGSSVKREELPTTNVTPISSVRQQSNVSAAASSPSLLLAAGSKLPQSGASPGTTGAPASSRIGTSLSPEIPRRSHGKSDVSSVCSASSFDNDHRGMMTIGGGGSVSSSASPSGSKQDFTPADYARLNSEYKKLKLKFEHLRRDRYRAPDVRESIRRLCAGESAILTMYRAMDEKVDLLNAALKSFNADCITTVLLYLKETLSYALFQEQLLKNPVAANHYVAHLRNRGQFSELVTLLQSLGRNDEAAMVSFRQSVLKSNVESKVSALRNTVQTVMGPDPNLVNETGLTNEYIGLLERQQPIDEADDQSNKIGREQKFKVYPKTASLVDQPVLTTLYYCCLYHYDLPQNSFASPLSMKTNHRLTEKQFCWTAIRALARQRKWAQIETLLTSKTLMGFGSMKIKSPIPYEKLLELLQRHSCGIEVLSKYVLSISDSDEKLTLAKKYGCHKVAVDCFVSSRDRVSLQEYLHGAITQHTQESVYANAALNNSSTKWKN